ncbi:MAG: TauD/TfdA family dioxygenase [Thermoanaerobaculia bacterium]
MRVETDEVLASLRRDGYFVARVPVGVEEAVRFVLEVGRSLGEIFVPKDCDPAEPVIRTVPTRARRAAPFDRPEAIGWHGDFATYEDRPEISLVYITRPDPRGGDFGAWRLASVARVIAALRATDDGRTAFDLLSRERLPFSYADGEAPRWFLVVESRSETNIGLRFYLPSIRRGCIAEYGEVPPRVAAALAAVEHAADDVTEIVPTQEGSLLIASNWFALHDRVRQTISRTRENREALLCFVAHQYVGPRQTGAA